MGDPRHDLGRAAERRTATWLESHGWRILAERHRSTAGEIDLVALDDAGCLVAVEVKLRRSGRAGSASESVRPDRVRRLRSALTAYARAQAPGHRGLRVDVVAVSPGPDPGTWRLSRMVGVDAW